VFLIWDRAFKFLPLKALPGGVVGLDDHLGDLSHEAPGLVSYNSSSKLWKASSCFRVEDILDVKAILVGFLEVKIPQILKLILSEDKVCGHLGSYHAKWKDSDWVKSLVYKGMKYPSEFHPPLLLYPFCSQQLIHFFL